jgi:UDP-N-acetylglucosamine 4,6-dehydratase
MDGANILLTGGTGSFGRRFLRQVTRDFRPERLIVFSRDELKQFHLRLEFPLDRFRFAHMFIGG